MPGSASARSYRRCSATYRDVLDAPPHKIAEIIAGELHLQPRPVSLHALVRSRLGGLLDRPFSFGRGGPGGWWIVHGPELHLGKDILVPDLAGWRRTTMPDYPDAPFFTVAPGLRGAVALDAKSGPRGEAGDLCSGRGEASLVRRTGRPQSASVRTKGGRLGFYRRGARRRHRVAPALRRHRLPARRPLALSVRRARPLSRR